MAEVRVHISVEVLQIENEIVSYLSHVISMAAPINMEQPRSPQRFAVFST